jgi:hypothetical protein
VLASGATTTHRSCRVLQWLPLTLLVPQPSCSTHSPAPAGTNNAAKGFMKQPLFHRMGVWQCYMLQLSQDSPLSQGGVMPLGCCDPVTRSLSSNVMASQPHTAMSGMLTVTVTGVQLHSHPQSLPVIVSACTLPHVCVIQGPCLRLHRQHNHQARAAKPCGDKDQDSQRRHPGPAGCLPVHEDQRCMPHQRPASLRQCPLW